MDNKEHDAAGENLSQIICPVCRNPLSFRIARGRKSGKPFLMVICSRDGRHFRGFVGDQTYVRGLIDRVEKNHAEEEVCQ
jgi:hypothetical protein